MLPFFSEWTGFMDGKTGHLAAKYMAIITSLFTLYASHS